MKNQFTITNIMSWPGLKPALAALMLLGIAASSSAGPSPAEVLPPSSLPYGYSYEEWSAKFWQWTLGQSAKHMESLGDPGICTGPASRVRFLGPSTIGGEAIHIETNHVTIAAGTPLFFSIFALWQDNGNCPLSAFTTFTADQLAGFDRDYHAVRNGLTMSWNSGTVEGKNCKFKHIKRLMYGRANFDLLRKMALLN